MKKFLTLLTALILSAGIAHAQDENKRTIEKLLPEADGMVHLSYTYDHTAPVKEVAGDNIAYHDIDFGGQIPAAISDDIYFAIGVKYNLHNFRIGNITGYFPKQSLNVHQIGVPMDMLFFFGDKWLLDINFTPTTASDFEGLDSDDFQYNGAVIAGWAFSDNASLLFGAGIGKDFWSYLPYPILGFIYRPDNSFFSIEAVLPAYLRADFQVSDPVSLFAAGKFYGLQWDIEGEGNIPKHYLNFIDSQAGGGTRFKVTKGFEIEIFSGINPYRKFEIRNNASNKVTREPNIGFFANTLFVITPEIFNR